MLRTEDDVKEMGFALADKPVEDWTSPEGQALLRILIPSADIINFSIAHHMAHLKKHDVWWGTVFMPVFFIVGYHVSVIMCRSEGGREGGGGREETESEWVGERRRDMMD